MICLKDQTNIHTYQKIDTAIKRRAMKKPQTLINNLLLLIDFKLISDKLSYRLIIK